jgi:hypothetical protein
MTCGTCRPCYSDVEDYNVKTVAKKKPAKPMDPEEIHQVLVRMPHRTWVALEEDARDNFRTINMHILWLIEERLRSIRGEEPSE